MASMQLVGPYRICFDDINDHVRPDVPGVFALGYGGARDTFFVNYIGRSDSDLRARLMDCIGSDALFKFEVSISSRAAFLRECELFHTFRPRGNRLHPARPRGADWTCPRCGFLDL